MIDIKQEIQSPFFKTIEAVIEYEAQQDLMLSEPQNLVDDDAVTRLIFSPKNQEASRISKELGLSELIYKRFAELYADEYGQPLEKPPAADRQE